MDEQKLLDIRSKIDTVDLQLLDLLNERARLALQAGIAKGSRDIQRPEREAEVLAQLKQANRGPLADDAITTIFKSIIHICRTIQLVK